MGQRADSGTGKKSYKHPCLIAQALDVLGDRWTLLILRDLMSGLHRYSDILENCHGMSPNVLSDRLKRLEAEGLVARQYHRELPPRVEYSLTEKGWGVRPVLLSLLEFSRTHVALEPEAVIEQMSVDFAVRVVPAFSFQPLRAVGMQVVMAVEISDCDTCNTWSFHIEEGHILPRRHAKEPADILLKTNAAGFFRFLRGEAAPWDCGELHGSPETASAIQACFLPLR